MVQSKMAATNKAEKKTFSQNGTKTTISNQPLAVGQTRGYVKRLDEIQTAEELKASRTGKPVERSVFPKGKDKQGTPYEQYRWSRFKNMEACIATHSGGSCRRKRLNRRNAVFAWWHMVPF
jgi:hypothetical protein